MGNNDRGKSPKSDKSSSPVPMDQNNIHVYPDWAAPAMQAYYSPHVNMSPYYNSAVASGHAPPTYMWGTPQPMMPPYATIYPHGAVYAHPAVPLPANPVDTPTKSSGNTEQGLMKKLKRFDNLAISIGNCTAENAERRAEPRPSQSVETRGSTDGSDGNTTGTDQNRRKRSWEGTPTIGGEGKNEAKSNPVSVGVATATGTALSPGVTIGSSLELSNTPTINATRLHCGVMPSNVWLQNERELKRERRKQSNRESARRSRLRKQAETEELARKVESLTSENAALRSEINQLTEKSEKLRLENAILTEGLKKDELVHAPENILRKEGEMCEEKSDSSAKLHQLLDPNPRADAVAAV